MKKIFLIMACLFSLVWAAGAQITQLDTPKYGLSLPATCNPNSKATALYYKFGASNGLYYCSATNVWTLVADAGDAGSVTSVGLAVPSFMNSSGGPVTTSGNITLSFANQSGNKFLASPSDGSSGALLMRALAEADLPNFSASKITSGTISTARLGSGTANGSTYLRGDGTWASVSAGGMSIGGAVASASNGSVFFADSSGNLAQANSRFKYNSTDEALFLGDTSYLGNTSGHSAIAGWQGTKAFLKIGFDTAFADNLNSVYGQQIDMKRSITAGTTVQTSGLRPRCWIVATGTAAANHICTSVEAFVENGGSSVSTNLQAIEGIVGQTAVSQWTAGGFFQLNNTANSTFEDWGVRSNIQRSAGSTPVAVAFQGIVAATSSGTITSGYGLRLSGWSGSGFTNSYGIYADTSIDRGSSLKYFIYSLSTSPSVFSGDVTVPAEAYGSGWNGSNEAPTKNDVYDKIETLSAGGGSAEAPLTLTNTTASDVPLTIVGAASQSGNLLNVTANGGADGGLFKIASDGGVTSAGRITLTGSGNYFATGDAAFGDVLGNGSAVINYPSSQGLFLRDNIGNLGFVVGGAAVASASSIQPTGTLFHVTGTTTITSILGTIGGYNIISGTEITIIFDGALTLTDGSNLKLAGNFVTTADDTITLKFDGTNWYEVSRSIN